MKKSVCCMLRAFRSEYLSWRSLNNNVTTLFKSAGTPTLMSKQSFGCWPWQHEVKLVLDCHATIMNGLWKTFYMMVYSNYELWPIYKMNLYAHLMILAHGNGKQRQLLQPNELYCLAVFPHLFAVICGLISREFVSILRVGDFLWIRTIYENVQFVGKMKF